MEHNRRQRGFSLAEVLATVVIASMVLIAVLTVYRRVEDSALAVNRNLDDARIPTEVLQRIAEDLDKIIATGPDSRLTIESRYEKGLAKSRLTITRMFTDKDAQEQLLDEITWQAVYDIERDNGTMILYRGHTGLSYEDKLLDSQRSEWEADYSMIPLCAGLTYFKVEVPQGSLAQDQWDNPTLPPGVRVTLSFAEPFETVLGTYDVLDSQKYTRTIAVDRTRAIRFELAPNLLVGDVNQPTGEEPVVEEANEPDVDNVVPATVPENRLPDARPGARTSERP